jgi:hypothetical protein
MKKSKREQNKNHQRQRAHYLSQLQVSQPVRLETPQEVKLYPMEPVKELNLWQKIKKLFKM